MPRIPIYPEVEKFITLKKRTKLKEVESDNKKENSTTQTPKRTCNYQEEGLSCFNNSKKECKEKSPS
ncbi:hypothetical protein PS15p_208165 [Mucor circinelloides]